MKFKITIFLCLGILSTLLLSACGSKTKSAKIIITISDWSGWSEDHDSEKKDESYTVKEGDSIELGGTVDLTIKILTISDSEVTFETNTPMLDNEDGTINLQTDKTEFKITEKKELKLMTPTMDAGNCYLFNLQE